MRIPSCFARLFASGLFLVATGCGHHRPPPRPSGPVTLPPGPRTLAILPLANSTLSVDGPQVLRERLADSARAHGYWVQPLRDTDERLRGIGVTLGGQLAGVKLSELRGALGTDGAIGGTLLKHQNVVLGVANTQTLEAEMMELDLVTERVIFSAHRRYSHQQNYVTNGGRGSQADAAVCLLSGVFGVLGGISRNNMKQESWQLSQILCQQMPPAAAGYPEEMLAANPPAMKTASAGMGSASRPMSTGATAPNTYPQKAPDGTDPAPPAPETSPTPTPTPK